MRHREMNLPARLGLLFVLFSLANCQRSKPKEERSQGRTLGLLSPLLFGGAGPLFDVPVPVAGVGGAGGGSAVGAAGGTQSDQYYGGGGALGGGYPSYGNGYGNVYGYRPNYGYGYPSLGLGYPAYYGYPSYNLGNYYRPNYNYNYGGYQRPVQYPGGYYGARPNYGSNYGTNLNYGGSPSYGGVPSLSPTTNPAVGSPGGLGAGSQLSTAQAAQLAGLLGQALGSSLRPLVANGGAGAGGAAGVGGNPQALSSLLGLLG